MKIFIQVYDYNVWKIIVDGPHTPHVLSERDKEMIQLNAKAMICFIVHWI